MEMKIVGLAVAAMVAVVVLAGVLMPVLDDYDKSVTETYTNTGSRSSPITESVTIVYDGSKVTVNGNECSGHVSFMSDAGFLSYNGSKTTLSFAKLGVSGYGGLTSLNVTADPSTKTISGTYTNSGHTDPTEITATWSDWAYAYDPAGEYVMNYYTSSSSDTPVYYNNISEVHAINTTSSSVYYTWSGKTVTLPDSTTATAGLDEQDISGISDAHYFNTRFNLSGLSYETGGTTYYPPYICAKATVEAMTDTDERNMEILAAIPALVIVAIITGIIVAIYRSR